MHRRIIIIGALALALVAWARAGAQQEMLPKPGPGSGVTPVSQRGDWQVAISNTPEVRIANGVPLRAPAFLKDAQYKLTWPNGDVEDVRIHITDLRRMAEKGLAVEDGWLEVSSGGRRRWINIHVARSIEEAR